MNCYVCDKRYKSWSGLFYHKRTIHNDTSVHSKVYDNKMKNQAKHDEDRAKKCLFCPLMRCKGTMEEHYRKKHHEKFAWVECELCTGSRQVRYDVFGEHIVEVHNKHREHGREDVHMNVDELESLFETAGGFDIAISTLKKMKDEQKNREQKCREITAELFHPDGRRRGGSLFGGRDPISGDLIGFR